MRTALAVLFGLVSLVCEAKTPAPAPVRVVAVGDIACGAKEDGFNEGKGEPEACHQASVAQLTRKLSPDSILLLGDVQYPGGALSDFLGSFDKSWGDLKPRIHPSPGNHEYREYGGSSGLSRAEGYFQYFGAAAGTAGEGWYSFELGGWHIISLNSNCRVVGCQPDSAQLKWLKADLDAHPDVCTLAFWHHPRFSTSAHGDDPTVEPFWALLSRAKADVVLNGHDHDYQRFTPLDAQGEPAPGGIREFVAGTGGKSLYPQSAKNPRATRLTSFIGFGVLTLALSPHGYAWKYVSEQEGAFSDAGSAKCHAGKAKSTKH